MLERNTTPEIREKLVAAGYIRVDGLVTHNPDWGQDPEGEVIKGLEPECKRWDGNNGVTAVAINSEIWLGVHSDSEAIEARRDALAEELGLERGLWVPCSNGETVDSSSLLHRLADPDWICPWAK